MEAHGLLWLQHVLYCGSELSSPRTLWQASMKFLQMLVQLLTEQLLVLVVTVQWSCRALPCIQHQPADRPDLRVGSELVVYWAMMVQ